MFALLPMPPAIASSLLPLTRRGWMPMPSQPATTEHNSWEKHREMKTTGEGRLIAESGAEWMWQASKTGGCVPYESAQQLVVRRPDLLVCRPISESFQLYCTTSRQMEQHPTRAITKFAHKQTSTGGMSWKSRGATKRSPKLTPEYLLSEDVGWWVGGWVWCFAVVDDAFPVSWSFLFPPSVACFFWGDLDWFSWLYSCLHACLFGAPDSRWKSCQCVNMNKKNSFKSTE